MLTPNETGYRLTGNIHSATADIIEENLEAATSTATIATLAHTAINLYEFARRRQGGIRGKIVQVLPDGSDPAVPLLIELPAEDFENQEFIELALTLDNKTGKLLGKQAARLGMNPDRAFEVATHHFHHLRQIHTRGELAHKSPLGIWRNLSVNL